MARRSRSNKKALPYFSADFETTTDPEDCRVWWWGAENVNDPDEFHEGTDIDGFMEWLLSTPSFTYFHNLAFDGSFIIDWLLNNGYRHVFDQPMKNEFTTLISNMGKFYSITIVSDEGRVELRDSIKKIPLSVDRISKAFKLETQKLDIDYEMHRPKGYQPTEHERQYGRNDVSIVAQALRLTLSTGMKKLTVGADALEEYKTIVGKKEFGRLFPTLTAEMDDEIRKAYRGGFTYADPRFAGRMMGSGLVFDVNSLYPSVMYFNPIPRGVPDYVDGAPPPGATHYITNITFTARIKEGHIPCIQIKRSAHFLPTEYQTRIDEPITVSVTSVDLEMWKKHYHLDIKSYNGTFVFETVDGVFRDYIDKWMAVKANSTGGMREIAKLHLNSLYGKFATNTNVTGKYPVLKNGVVTLKLGPAETRPPVYTPAGVFITAYARRETLTAAQANYDRFAYADTDSMHLIGTEPPKNIRVHDSDLGAWKCEGAFTRAVYVRAKQYAETMEGGHEAVHIAGLPSNIASHLTPEDLLTDHTWHGKLLPRRVPGGIVLEPTTFSFKARKEAHHG